MKPIALIPYITQLVIMAAGPLTFDDLHEKLAKLATCDLCDLYDAIELMEDSGVLHVVRDQQRDVVSVQRGGLR